VRKRPNQFDLAGARNGSSAVPPIKSKPQFYISESSLCVSEPKKSISEAEKCDSIVMKSISETQKYGAEAEKFISTAILRTVSLKTEPNQALQTRCMLVTPAASHPSRQARICLI